MSKAVLSTSFVGILLDLHQVPRFDDEFVEEITSTQGILNRWHYLIEGVPVGKRTNEDQDSLGNWENEGGSLDLSGREKL